MRLLEAKNTKLAKEVRQLSADIQPRLIGLSEPHVQQLLISQLEHKVSALEAVRLDLEELLGDFPSVIELVGKLYPDRITVAAWRPPDDGGNPKEQLSPLSGRMLALECLPQTTRGASFCVLATLTHRCEGRKSNDTR